MAGIRRKPQTYMMGLPNGGVRLMWQRSAAAEGRWGSLTMYGTTKLVTVCRGYDSPSCGFIVKFIEVIPVPRFQELKCFRTKTLDGPLCL
ncbi:hypothetical protein EJD97_019914 [Solanum chilense]|uniref:Uncharacterized protein n=1 Tax=Solanum chilense TaxID=4083 RepID=A0A6N2B0R1_SOLCI|nr:hypothetical protein EJD97_019914 [Solanum chilense]